MFIYEGLVEKYFAGVLQDFEAGFMSSGSAHFLPKSKQRDGKTPMLVDSMTSFLSEF